MKSPALCQISVETTPEAEEAVAALLERLFGRRASVYADAETGTAIVSVYAPKTSAFPKREALAAGLKYVEDSGLTVGAALIAIRRLPREDWAESWKKHFQVIEIGDALLIKPSWTKRRPSGGQAVVVLDPGLSFGTGRHATTSFCLHQLVACREMGHSQSFLDIGTGTGILAIAAAKLKYGPVRGIDNDPVSVRVARANARRNRVAERLSISRSDLTRWSRRARIHYDLICANLIDTLLISESTRILSRLRPGGRLVLAGILTSQFGPLQKAYAAAGLELVQSETEREWQSGLFQAPL